MFPLAPIRDDRHLGEAQGILDKLLERELDEGEQAYLEVLTNLVEDYEEEHVPIEDASEADVLRMLVDGSGLSQAQLAKKVGVAQSTISAVLTGTRSLTKDQILKFARFFNTSPAAFLPR
jgi:HTH-type transcriptional regulator/antitoxin HigA